MIYCQNENIEYSRETDQDKSPSCFKRKGFLVELIGNALQPSISELKN